MPTHGVLSTFKLTLAALFFSCLFNFFRGRVLAIVIAVFFFFIAGKHLPLGHSEYPMCRSLINPTFFLPVLIDVHEFQTSLELSLF